jgi:hypothetical protein
VSILAGKSRCLGMRPAVHRDRSTIVPPAETSNVPRKRQVWKRVSREEGVADRRSSRSIALLEHAPSDPSRRIHGRRVRRNTRRAADGSNLETGFARRGARPEALQPPDRAARTPIQGPSEADSQSPRPSKRATCRRRVRSRNGSGAHGKPPRSAPTARAGCLGTEPAPQRGRSTIATLLATPNAPTCRRHATCANAAPGKRPRPQRALARELGSPRPGATRRRLGHPGRRARPEV